jgi:hypothetical protein
MDDTDAVMLVVGPGAVAAIVWLLAVWIRSRR